MRGFTLLELIIVITITTMLTLVVLPTLERKFFGEKDILRAFILKNLNLSMKTGRVIELLGNGKSISSSTGEKLNLPLEGRCYIYPSGELRQCWFGKGGERVYYTLLDF